jgi:hypothetical protein
MDPRQYNVEVPLPVDLEINEREWTHHLSREIGAEGLSGTAVPYGGWLIQRTSPPLRTALLLMGASGSCAAFVVSDDEPPSDVEVAFWTKAVERAANTMRTTESDVRWVAIIGPSFESSRQEDCALTERGKVGPIFLEPLTTPHYDYVSQDPHFIVASAMRAFRSHPVMAKGVVRTYSWWDNGPHAAGTQLGRITAILTLATGSHWVIRMRPDVDRQQEPLKLPPRSPALAASQPMLEDQNHINPVPFSLAPWMDSAWSLVDKDQKFADALFAYAEGMSLRERHASLAFLSFVAAIEAIGSKYVESERCPSCGVTTGAGKQFRHAATMVMSEEEAKLLNPYAKRSRIAHSGKLHGFETSGGISQSPGFFQSQPEHSFSSSLLPRLAEVSALLLRRIAEGA